MDVDNPVRRTAMYHAQISRGALMGDADGWQRPLRFGSAASELELLRTAAGIHDISPNGQVRVIGSGVPAVIQTLAPKQPPLPVGRVLRGEVSTETSRLSVNVARLTEDEIAVLTPPGVAPAVVAALEATTDGCAHVLDVSSALAGVALIGPYSAEILSAITELDVSPEAMPDLTCAQSRFAEIQGLLLREAAAGLPSYQIYLSREFGEYFWEAITEAAQEIGAGPVGTEAMTELLASS